MKKDKYFYDDIIKNPRWRITIRRDGKGSSYGSNFLKYYIFKGLKRVFGTNCREELLIQLDLMGLGIGKIRGIPKEELTRRYEHSYRTVYLVEKEDGLRGRG